MILMAVEGWGEKEICIKGAVDGHKKGEGYGWGSEDCAVFPHFSSPLPPPSTLTPHQTWPVG